MSDAKILALDIETKPSSAYVWGLHKVNVSVNQIIEPGGVICVGAKWLGDKDMYMFADWHEGGHVQMLKDIHAMMSEADAVLTFNGDSFDLPRLNGEFLLNGLPPLPPVTSIDIYKTTKKMKFTSGKLAFIGPLLGVGAKVKHEGFELWKMVMDGDAKAQKRMEAYCAQDVRLLDRLYMKVRPFITNHPFLADRKACGACDSTVLHSRGYRRTKTMKIQRLQCQTCGSWSDGKKEKMV